MNSKWQKWQLEIRDINNNTIATIYPLSDQEHLRVTLREGCKFWKRTSYGGLWSDWKQLDLKPQAYVIILGINDCAINDDNSIQNLELRVATLEQQVWELKTTEYEVPEDRPDFDHDDYLRNVF